MTNTSGHVIRGRIVTGGMMGRPQESRVVEGGGGGGGVLAWQFFRMSVYGHHMMDVRRWNSGALPREE